MEGIIEVMKKVARKESRWVMTTEAGEVTAVFPHEAEDDKGNYQCSVKLKNKRLADGSELELRNVPVSVPYIGWAAIPRVGDLVLIQFIGGDINSPVITGRLYNDAQRPPLNKEGEFLLQHGNEVLPSVKFDGESNIIITTKEEKKVITINDDSILIEDADGGSIKLDGEGRTTVISANEKNKVVIDDDTISLESGTDIILTASQGKVAIDAKEVEIKSSAAAKVEAGSELGLKAGGAASLAGSTVDIN